MRFRFRRYLAVLVLGAPIAGRALAEPFLMRDARPLPPWSFLVEGSAWWGTSRGGFDREGNLLSLDSTPGVAFARGVSGTVRAGLPCDLEAAFSDAYLTQEVKIDRTDAFGSWDGSYLYRGEGEGDKLLSLKWTALSGGHSALALEAGVKMPTARGPEEAGNRYERLGDGGWACPVGIRINNERGVVCAYLEGFWQWSAPRHVDEWYGVRLPQRGLYRPGQGYWVSAGAELGTPHFSWALEISREVTERDRGNIGSLPAVPGGGNGLEPRRESLVLVPSLILPASRATEIRLAALVPVSGRNAYQVFTAAVSVRRYF